MTRVIVTGCRHWAPLRLAESTVARLKARYDDLTIVHGDCRTGVDAAFEDVCRRMRVATEPHPADWSKGKRAGPERNAEMIRSGGRFVVAVHENLGRSRGTRNTVELALRAGIPCYLIASHDAEPVRVRGFDGFEVRTQERTEA